MNSKQFSLSEGTKVFNRERLQASGTVYNLEKINWQKKKTPNKDNTGIYVGLTIGNFVLRGIFV